MSNLIQKVGGVLGIPKLAALILGVIGVAAQVVNYSVIPAGSQLHALIALGLYFLIAAGIPPLAGDKFQAAIHLPSGLYYVINALLGVALLALGSIHMDALVHETLAAFISFASALGFSASVAPVPVQA